MFVLAQLTMALGAAAAPTEAQYASWTDSQLILDNGVVRRGVTLKADGILTSQLTLAEFPDSSMVSKDKGGEFRFVLHGGRTITGASGWSRPR